ncbi:MAG: response regulator [Deltaproteobacteria bacterium]|jgi:CheY-like chemotaxis protein
MSKGILNGKQVLAVDDEPDVLDILEEELEEYGVDLDKATSYQEANQKISSLTYDLVILDIMGVRGFDLLRYAVAKKLPVVMLTAHALSPETLKKSIELGARAYLPKDQLGQIAPFLEDVLMLNYQSAWKAVLGKLGSSFGKRFGPEWRKSEKEFWQKFEKELDVSESTIIEP